MSSVVSCWSDDYEGIGVRRLDAPVISAEALWRRRYDLWVMLEHVDAPLRLARFPLERNRSRDEKSPQIKKLERVLIAKLYQLLRKLALMGLRQFHRRAHAFGVRQYAFAFHHHGQRTEPREVADPRV
jgi:hypothetical protein